LEYARDRFEVIVVDDGSRSSLTSVIAPWQTQLNLTLLRQANAGPAAARNRGAAHAQGKYLAFTDDDCSPLQGWLSAFESALEHEQALFGGQTLNALPDNLWSTASQLLIDYLYQYYNIAQQVAEQQAQQAQFFASLGGFDTSFPLAAGEDREFCDRWQQLGYSLKYIPTAQIAHAHHLKLKSFWRQHFNYGRGAFHFHRSRAHRQQTEIRVEPLKFYFNLLKYPTVKPTEHPAWSLSLLLFLSQAATVLGFFWERGQIRQELRQEW
jgi:glycosyltransferase involved in cell wall biosynthesis